MSLLDDLRNIDPRDPGRWPLAVSASAVGIVFLVLSAVATYMLVYTNQDPQLQSLESQEESLRA